MITRNVSFKNRIYFIDRINKCLSCKIGSISVGYYWRLSFSFQLVVKAIKIAMITTNIHIIIGGCQAPFRYFANITIFKALQVICEVGTFAISMLELRHRKVKQLAQGNTASKWQSQHTNSGSLVSELWLLTSTLYYADYTSGEENIEKHQLQVK